MLSLKTGFSSLAIGFVALWTSAAHADLILSYDSPTLQLAPGQSVDIGATLANMNGPFALTTDSSGVQTIAEGFTSRFTVRVQEQLFISAEGAPPNPYLAQHSQFVVSQPNPMAELDIAAGSSRHLILGTLTIDPTAPAGLYTGPYGIDVGIYEASSFPCSGVCVINVELFAPPTIDAGILAVNVTAAAHEPGILALFGIAAVGIRFVKRRRPSTARIPAYR